MQRLLFVIFFSPAILFGAWGDLFEQGNDPLVHHHVNVITGKLNLSCQDHTVRGAVPLSLQRSYTNDDPTSKKGSKWQFEGGWSFFAHTVLQVEYKYEKFRAHVMGNSGRMTFVQHFGEKEKHKVFLKPPCMEQQQSEVMSYRANPCNHRMVLDREKQIATLYFANGTIRRYRKSDNFGKGLFNGKLYQTWKGTYKGLGKKYLLIDETSPSGHKTTYRYRGSGLQICAKNPAGDKTFAEMNIHFVPNSSDQQIEVTTSDGESFCYSWNKSGLHTIKSPGKPKEYIGYGKKKKLDAIYIPGRDGLKVSYIFPQNKVKEVYEGGLCVATFSYKNGLTNVNDADNILTRYFHKDGNINKIERYGSDRQLISTETYEWEEGNLIAKVLTGRFGKEIYKRTFAYDEFKNVIKETLGEFTKTYRYDENHFRIEEKEKDGPTYRYKYLPGTDLLISKKTYDGEKLIVEEQLIYDEDRLLSERRTISGSFEKIERYERDPQTGMIISQSDGLLTTNFQYDEKNRVVTETTNDRVTAYSYDEAGRLFRQTFPMGAVNEYVYDSFGNPIEIKEVGSPRKYIEYDKRNAPVKCYMNGKESFNKYDVKGRLASTIDYNGSETTNKYGRYGKSFTKILPEVQDENGMWYRPQVTYTYDIFRNIECQSDTVGNITKTEYNIFRKPTLITFPDKTTIQNSYYSNGELKETTLQDGSKISYRYDALQRPIQKIEGEFEERWEYDGLLLKSYLDVSGLLTTFEYDEYGRKILENRGGRTKAFAYDVYSNVTKVTEGDIVFTTEYDLEGRVTSTGEDGFNSTFYEYDIEGRKIKATKGEAEDLFFYDEEGRLISHLDPLEGETTFVYDDFARTTIDPLGNKEIERFDRIGRIICKEKASETDTLLKEMFFFDRAGNIARRATEGFDQDVVYTYDCMGRKLSELESGIKLTQFTYDEKGRLLSKLTPNRVYINHTYDRYDRIKSLISTDCSVCYKYFYKGTDLCEIKDCNRLKTLKRTYNEFGELLEEKGFSGFKTSWYYDMFGRTKGVILPDKSSITYDYRGSCMTKVSRHNKKGEEIYSHEYTNFDLNHHVVKESLPFNLGAQTTTRDLLERPTSLISSFHNLEYEFGPTSLIEKKKNSILGNTHFEYDSLSQLTKENEKAYDFDELGNPQEYETNNLNQILSTGDENLSYDENGNLVKKGSTVYCYDALNRLTDIKTPESQTTFSYDPFSRLVFKDEAFITTYYLYDKEQEIGMITKSGQIEELRVLGLGIGADIGAAVAIELHDKIYIPLHDLQGNVIALLNTEGEMVESYKYSSFGEDTNQDYINPWRFSSKRHTSDLIFFGLRFYDPSIQRWTTPDPLGFKDSRNPYLFVLNNPTNRLDEFGLEAGFIYKRPESIPFNSVIDDLKTSKPPSYMPDLKSQIEPSFNSSVVYQGRTMLRGVAVDLLVVCSRDYALDLTDSKMKNFNLETYLPKILAGVKTEFALVGYVNGMNQQKSDWIHMGKAIFEKLPHGTFMISVFNPSDGLYNDLSRVGDAEKRSETYGVKSQHALLTTILDAMKNYAPQGKFLYETHSEGVAIYKTCAGLLSSTDLKKLNYHGCIDAYGGVGCIPDMYGYKVVNYISKRDGFSKHFKPENEDGYTIKMLDCISSYSEMSLYCVDHTFLGSTYQTQLVNNIGEHNGERGFYVGNQR